MIEETPLAEIENEPTTSVLENEPQVEGEALTEEDKAEAEKTIEKTKAKKRLSDRNKDLTYRLRESERQGRADKEELANLRAANQIKSKPDPDNYDDRDELDKDNKKWNEQELAKIRVEERDKILDENDQKSRAKQIKDNEAAYTKGRAQVLKDDPNLHAHEETLDEFFEQTEAYDIKHVIYSAKETGPKIVSYLGSHPDELEELATLSPAKRLVSMGRILAKLEAKPVKTSSTAPAPTTSERGSARSRAATSSPGKNSKSESWKERCRRVNGIK